MNDILGYLVLCLGVSCACSQYVKSPEPYTFGYTAGRAPGHVDRYHTESGDGSGNVKGQFSFVDPRQQVRTVQYVADQQGFHPSYSGPVLRPNQDTQAVAAAKQKHNSLYHKIAEDQQRLAATRDAEPAADGFDDGSYRGNDFYGDDGSYRESHHYGTGPDADPARYSQGPEYTDGDGYNPYYANYYSNGQPYVAPPVETAEVQQERQKHAELFNQIAEDHRRIAAERGHESDAPLQYDY